MAIAKITELLILSCKRQLLPGIFYIFHALCGVIVCILFILSRFILFRSFLTAEVSIKNFCNNFLHVFFSDTRENHDYSESHVITAKFAPRVRLILLSCFQWFSVLTFAMFCLFSEWHWCFYSSKWCWAGNKGTCCYLWQ